MNLGIVPTVFQKLTSFTISHSTTILTTLSVGGVVTTTIMAVDAGAKAYDILSQERGRRVMVSVEAGNGTEIEPLTKTETVKLVWKQFIPTLAMGMTTIVCIIGGHVVSERRYGALAAMYGLAETSINEYRKKVVETIGEDKEKEIRDAVDQKMADKSPGGSIIYAGGDFRCLDTMSSRYFKTDIQKVRKAVNDFNEHLLHNLYGTLNEWYGLIGLPTTILGEDIGWTSNQLLAVDFSSTLTEEGVPCIVLDYLNRPNALGKGTKFEG